MTVSDSRLQDLTGVYIARGAHEFYLLSLHIKGQSHISTSLILKNIPTPFSSESVDIPSEACVEIDIDVPSNSDRLPTGELSSLEHNELCGLGKQMASGEKGTVDLAMTALAFATDVIGVQHFTFTDASFISCDEQTISLRQYSLLTKGKTWYARHFPNVEAESPRTRLSLEEFEQKVVERQVTQGDAIKLHDALYNNMDVDEQIRDNCWRVVVISTTLGQTWRQMLVKMPCSFFVDSVLSVIERALRLADVFRFRLHLEDAHVDAHLKKYQQVYH